MFCSLEIESPNYTRRRRLVVLASGSGTNFENLVHACREDRVHADVVGLVVNRPNAGAVERADALDIPARCIDHKTFPSREAFDRNVAMHIESWNPDLVVLAGWMRIATEALIDRFQGKMLNIHPSLLPAFPGMRAIEQAFDAGAKITGCTVHVVEPGVDEGPIVGQCAIKVQKTLHATTELVHRAEYLLYPRAVQSYLNLMELPSH